MRTGEVHISQVIKMREEKQKLSPNTYLRRATWTAFLTHYKKINKTSYSQDPQSMMNVGSVLSYFTKYEKFFESPILNQELNEPSFDKGLLIIGSYGNGKTSVMEAFASVFKKYNYSCRFKIFNSRDIVQEYECCSTPEQKKDFWNKYMTPILCIDDIKKERKASNYGVSEVVGDIVIMRYNKGLKTHLTCNYEEGDKEQDLKNGLLEFSRYGEHFYDRIFEMFNIIEFQGKSKR